MSETLKPCPFCGGEAEVEDCRYGYYVSCQSPTCLVSPETGDYETKASAIVAWNRRAGDE